VSLFEGVILLIIAGISIVVWWGVKRLVKINDDEAKRLESIDKSIVMRLESIDKSLAKICERLGRSDIWMEMHSKQDDERHEEIKRIHNNLQKAVDELKLKK